MTWFFEEAERIDEQRQKELTARAAEEAKARLCREPKRVLLLPPDLTRMHTGSGKITEELYKIFSPTCDVHVIPTLGQHVPHTAEENRMMFGSIPHERIHPHDWRDGCVKLGEIPAAYVKEVSKGKADWPIPIELNRMLMEEKWDLIINVGCVVPHEVLGFANHNKNYFIGLGGKNTICASHMMAACYGIENNLGCLVTPLRACYNKAEEEMLGNLPDLYVQVVLARNKDDELATIGFYVGDDLDTYLRAAKLSRERNITTFDEPVKKIVAVMQADEFRRTWVANKAIYRTRMAMADDGELLILAPGLERFGEQPEVDAFIRKYGYRGTPYVMENYRKNADMQDLAHAAAHLIHGSSEGRFRITYAPGKMTREEVEGVGYGYAALEEMMKRYRPEGRTEGRHVLPDGEEFFFIPTPSAGLWSTKQRLYERDEK